MKRISTQFLKPIRTALISDIHGNYGGLLAVLADVEERRCDRILCLGDLVDGGPQSAEVVRLVQELAIRAVQGNHDEYPNTPLPPTIEDYLRELPEAIVEGSVIYTHTSPRVKKSKIGDAVEAWNVFEETDFRRVFVGDVHIPLIFGEQCREKVSALSYPIPYDTEFPFAADDRYIVCVGAGGYSRDGCHWLRYAVYDDARDTITYYAPEGPILVFLAMLDSFRWGLLLPGDTVLVAVSGGPDSLCLLHRLWAERETRQISVEAAHLDHGLRGEESAAEAEWVAAWCAERGIACHVGKEDVAAFASAHKRGKQEAARMVRYAFLERTAAAVGANKIATGHNRDDQAETVLGHILRGTGTDGLRGIPEQRGLIIRPMLGVSRAEVEAYCTAHGLTPQQDASNFSPDHYTRNRLRLELLPQLRRDYNPRVDAALVRLSEIAAGDSDFLALQAVAALADVTRERDAFRIQLDRTALAAMHPALLRSVLRRAIADVRGTGEGVSYEHLEKVCRAVPSGNTTAFALMLPYPLCTVRVAEQRLTLTLANVPVSLGDVLAALPVPGEAHLPEIGWNVRALWEDHPGAVRLDAGAVDFDSLAARNRRSGDKMDPLGMGGRHKKVSDIFTDAKVPRSQRHQIPIVADAQGIVWVVGHTLAERVKVTEKTVQVLYLSVQKTRTGEKGGR